MIPTQVPFAPPPLSREVHKAIFMGAMPNLVTPPPLIDPLYTGYEGIPGVIETLAVLGILGAAAYVGVTTALSTRSAAAKVAGWVGGAGAALLGLLYLGGKSGANDYVGLPALRVVP